MLGGIGSTPGLGSVDESAPSTLGVGGLTLTGTVGVPGIVSPLINSVKGTVIVVPIGPLGKLGLEGVTVTTGATPRNPGAVKVPPGLTVIGGGIGGGTFQSDMLPRCAWTFSVMVNNAITSNGKSNNFFIRINCLKVAMKLS